MPKERKKKSDPKSPAELFKEGLALYEGDGVKMNQRKGLSLIAEAARLGDPDAKYWIDDYTYDDDAYTQGVS